MIRRLASTSKTYYQNAICTARWIKDSLFNVEKDL